MNVTDRAYVAHCVREFIGDMTCDYAKTTNQATIINDIMQRNNWFTDLDYPTEEIRNLVKEYYLEYE